MPSFAFFSEQSKCESRGRYFISKLLSTAFTTATHLDLITPSLLSSFFFSKSISLRTNMSNVEWDSKLVIGSKAVRPSTVKKQSDLNGEFAQT